MRSPSKRSNLVGAFREMITGSFLGNILEMSCFTFAIFCATSSRSLYELTFQRYYSFIYSFGYSGARGILLVEKTALGLLSKFEEVSGPFISVLEFL